MTVHSSRLPDADHDDADPLRRQTKVQFPDHVKQPTTIPMPYPFLRHDSDLSSRSGDDEDSEDYDWSGEEDLVDEAAKFEQTMGKKTKREGWGFKRIISLLFTSLIGSTFLAGVLVAPALLLQFYWYTPEPTEYRRFVKDNVQAWLFWAAVNLLTSWLLAMIIDLIPILTRFAVSAIWGHVSEAVKSKIETFDSVKDTAKPAFYAGSAYASWAIIFGGVYKLYNGDDPDSARAGYTRRTAQAVQFFFFLILVWTIQRMLSHFIAFSFHRTAYRDRIENVEHALSVIEKLRQYKPKPTTSHQTPFGKSGTRTPIFGFGTSNFTEKQQRQHFKLLSGALREASPPVSRAETEDGNYADAEDADKTLVHKNKKRQSRLSWFRAGQKPENDMTEFGGRDVEASMVTSESSPIEPKIRSGTSDSFPMTKPSSHRYDTQPGGDRASIRSSRPPSIAASDSADATLRQAAKVIKNAVLHDARNLSGGNEGLAGLSWNVNSAHEAKRLAKSIFTRFRAVGRTWLIASDFNPAFETTDEAIDAYKVFDKDNNGDISRAEIKTTLLKIYKERRFLSRSMRDVGEALKTLDRILLFFAACILFFISLSVFGVEVGDSLTSIYSIGIAASFIFRNAASSAFDSIMFLFVTHPFDTGDRVFVDAENLVVKKVGLFATVFSRFDGTETYYFNSQLFNKFIINVRRSGKTFENLTMQIAWKTPLTKLDALEKCLNDWLSTEENRWFEPSTNITFQHVVYQRYLELTIGIGHNGNWQDWGLRLARKTAFNAAVQYYCRQLGIVGYEAPLPIVWADPTTMTYNPTTPLPDDVLSPIIDPLSPNTMEQRARDEAAEVQEAAKTMKPSLGFLPPLADRSSHLRRVRKSRNKKANVGAGNA